MNTPINLQKIADELDFDLEDVEMLFEVFLADTQDTLIDLKEAIKVNDYENIFKLAHAIKGSAGNILLDDISMSAQKIEHSARERELVDYGELLKVLEEKIELCAASE